MAGRREHEELTVITKTYDFILWSCNHTGKFPRNHRFVLGERIERKLYDLVETLIRARYTRQRRELLEQANLLPGIPSSRVLRGSFLGWSIGGCRPWSVAFVG
jgi:hypothetical protein